MDELWAQVLIALVAGFCGAGIMLAVSRARQQRPAPVDTPPLTRPPTPDRWRHDVQRCEQAVHRAARAVDAVSSEQARQGLRTVVRRMDAELPNVRALAELGRSLATSEAPDEAVERRVRRQLDDAAVRFGMVTDQVLETVVQLVADRDLGRVHEQVTVLREQFPLVRPMSAVFGPEPGSTPARALQQVA